MYILLHTCKRDILLFWSGFPFRRQIYITLKIAYDYELSKNFLTTLFFFKVWLLLEVKVTASCHFVTFYSNFDIINTSKIFHLPDLNFVLSKCRQTCGLNQIKAVECQGQQNRSRSMKNANNQYKSLKTSGLLSFNKDKSE
jgi:hypothetical protein